MSQTLPLFGPRSTAGKRVQACAVLDRSSVRYLHDIAPGWRDRRACRWRRGGLAHSAAGHTVLVHVRLVANALAVVCPARALNCAVVTSEGRSGRSAIAFGAIRAFSGANVFFNVVVPINSTHIRFEADETAGSFCACTCGVVPCCEQYGATLATSCIFVRSAFRGHAFPNNLRGSRRRSFALGRVELQFRNGAKRRVGATKSEVLQPRTNTRTVAHRVEHREAPAFCSLEIAVFVLRGAHGNSGGRGGQMRWSRGRSRSGRAQVASRLTLICHVRSVRVALSMLRPFDAIWTSIVAGVQIRGVLANTAGFGTVAVHAIRIAVALSLLAPRGAFLCFVNTTCLAASCAEFMHVLRVRGALAILGPDFTSLIFVHALQLGLDRGACGRHRRAGDGIAPAA
jgi:hypothetical protein